MRHKRTCSFLLYRRLAVDRSLVWSDPSYITALIGAILLGVGLVGYLFRPVGIVRRILFVVAAVGLLAPVVNTGQYAVLTWASNSVGALLAAICSFPSGWNARLAPARRRPS